MDEAYDCAGLAEAGIDADALCLIACALKWRREGDIRAGRELVRKFALPDPVLKAIAEAGLVDGGVRSIALVEEALASGQLGPEDGGPCLQKLLGATLPDCFLPN